MRLKSICDELLLCFNRSKILVEKYGGGGRLYYFIDMIWSLFRYGAKSVDYCMFEFYRKSNKERNRYLTSLRYSTLYRSLKKSVPDISGDKISEYLFFEENIKREWLIVDKNTDEQPIIDFINKHKVVIAKPNRGEQGHGVLKIRCEDEILLNKLLELRFNDSYILEEALINCHELAEINASSLNTVRVTTITSPSGDVHIFSIILRVGIQGSHVDNWGSGGIAYNFDIEHGICNQYGRDKLNRCYAYHPYSDIKMIGFQLPRFKELKEYIYALASMAPNAKYTGWDVAITPNGFDLVEMNCPAGHDMFQSFDNPAYEFMKNLWQ